MVTVCILAVFKVPALSFKKRLSNQNIKYVCFNYCDMSKKFNIRKRREVDRGEGCQKRSDPLVPLNFPFALKLKFL